MPESSYRPRRRRRRAPSLVILIILMITMVGGLAAPAQAVGISIIYDDTIPGAIDPCDYEEEELPACADEVDRTDEMIFLVEVAAAYWSTIYHDLHSIEIHTAWVVDQAPSASVVTADANGRALEARLRVPADLPWFYDPTPFEDEEFNMEPRLFRNTHPHEQGEAFDGSPPEIFEVSYVGFGQGNDLLTVLLHEIGHILGLNGDTFSVVPTCDEENDPYYHLDPTLVGGATMALRAYTTYEDFPETGAVEGAVGPLGHIDQQVDIVDCAHLALGGIQECEDETFCESHQALMWFASYPNSRMRPGVADILAIATAAGWEEVRLPRKFSVTSGLWQDGSTWIGDLPPHDGNDVYILNQEEDVLVTLHESGAADDISITDGNDLLVLFGDLNARRITMLHDGTTVSADSGATIDAVYIDIGAASMLDVSIGSTVDVFWDLTNATNGIIRGGGDSVIEVHRLLNRGIIRANGDSLTIRSSQDGPALDLNGPQFPYAYVEATAGDLVFDGQLTDPVGAAVTISSGHSITFTEGWTKQYTNDPETALRLLGTNAPATIHGQSQLAGETIVDGVGAVTSGVTFGPSAVLRLTLGAMLASSDHDRLEVDDAVQFAGTLDLDLAPGFEPVANETYTLVTYGSHAGEFTAIDGWDLGDLRLYPEYTADELYVVARHLGDVNADGALDNKDKSALAKSFGACTPDPVPCAGDIDADGDIDTDDLHLLKDILKNS